MTGNGDRDIRALLAAAHTSAGLLAALTTGAAPDETGAGQLWRAVWGARALLVLALDSTSDGWLDAVAVTVDPGVPQGSRATVTPATFENLATATVWNGARARIHGRVLDTFVEDSDASRAVAAAVRSTDTSEDLDPFDPAADLLAALQDELDALTEAQGLPISTTDDTAQLRNLLPGDGAAKITTVMKVLDAPQANAMDLLRGQRHLTHEQASALETSYGLDPGTLPSEGGFPASFVTELEHPRWRPGMRPREEQHPGDEATRRRAAAAEVYALAARESGYEPNWRQRLAHLLGEPR